MAYRADFQEILFKRKSREKMDKSRIFGRPLVTALRLWAMPFISFDVFGALFCPWRLALQNTFIRYYGNFHDRHRIYRRNRIDQAVEGASLGLFQRMGKYKRDHLPSFFLLLGNFGHSLLFFDTSIRYYRNLSFCPKPAIFLCHRLLLRHIFRWRFLFLQDPCKNQKLCKRK